jgi:MinD superfamily P-loop ATPase
MKQLVILSGKGGTGKTTLASSFIRLADHKVFADCDVDAPNLHQVLSLGETAEEQPFYGLRKAVKYDDICTNCGRCEELCRFGAIENGKVNPYECEGCGVCEAFCPAKDHEGRPAIRLEERESGKTKLYQSNDEVFSTAELFMGSGASGRLVTEVRRNLYKAAGNQKYAIIDGSPGIGCPVIASVTGAHMVLIVAEPTVSGIHDMKRIVETARRFGTKIAVCINKFDVSKTNTSAIKRFCRVKNLPIIGMIPFDSAVVNAINSGKTVVECGESVAGNAIRKIWKNVKKMLLS